MARTEEQRAAHAAAERRRRAADPEKYRAAVRRSYAKLRKAPEPEPWPEGLRRCGGLRGMKGCGQMLPVAEFAKDAKGLGGLYAYCRSCTTKRTLDYRARIQAEDPDRWVEQRRRAYDAYLAKRYGLTPAQIIEIRERQDDRCAICQRHAADLPRKMVIDHDHSCCDGPASCGRCVRGMLCGACNTGLGRFGDDVQLLRNAIAYLGA